MQIRLQNELRQNFSDQYDLEIKRGEAHANGEVLSNETVGLYLMAFDLKEPWGTHRKYQVFEDKHSDLFGRPEVNADRIVLCHVIAQAIDSSIPKINNELLARYVLTRYFLLYCVRQILDSDGLAAQLLQDPKTFVRNQGDRTRFRKCIQQVVDDVVIDLKVLLQASFACQISYLAPPATTCIRTHTGLGSGLLS